MDIGNPRYIEDVQASFEHNCMDAQKSNVFYQVCEDMYDDMYAMTDDYMSNRFSIPQMCVRAKICKVDVVVTMEQQRLATQLRMAAPRKNSELGKLQTKLNQINKKQGRRGTFKGLRPKKSAARR